jgi:WD40 repeat protein
MGGLVIKKAYILARQESHSLADRIQCLFFLATPHRGSDSATLLNNALKSSGLMSARPYINDLTRNSVSLQVINDEFRNHADRVKLWSFFETIQTNFGFQSALVVDKASAVLGYKHERTQLLNADHRGVCKFDSPSDPNYVTLRNALVAVSEDLLVDVRSLKEDEKRTQIRNLETYLNMSDTPEGDLMNQEEFKAVGSCQWIEHREKFQYWRDDHEEQLKVYWLNSKPGTGKSVCTAHVMSHLREFEHDCSYYFFKYGDKSKQSLSDTLRSIAYQMAILHPGVRQTLLSMQDNNRHFDKDDESAIWRKIFVNGILKTKLERPQFWVLDALDECSHPEKLFPLLLRMESVFPIRIFVTSRPSPEFDRHFSRFGQSLISDGISSSDTEADMRLYLGSDMTTLPVDDADERTALVDNLLAKSAGCFLWIRLVHQELEHVYSDEMIASVLQDMPVEMGNLYQRSIEMMSKNTREKELTKAILTWVVCAARPLKLSEIQAALKVDVGMTVRNIKQSIEGLCGQLLHVDKTDVVQVIHSTVREFLLDTNLESEFAVRRESGHERLAKSCLKFIQEEMRSPRNRSLGNLTRKTERPIFSDYACTAFSAHISGSSSTSDSLLLMLSQFLKSSVLSWIEYVAAEKQNLYVLIRTAKSLKEYLKRQAKHKSPLGHEVQVIDGWATDLIRLVAKFGRNILNYPSSIYFLTPPFAPPDSMIHQQFRGIPNAVEVVGLSSAVWEDCVSFIPYRNSWATALSCGENLFAIGMKSGTVFVYFQTTCQEKCVFHNPEPVKYLKFDSICQRLASAGPKSVRLWSLEGHLLWALSLQHPCATLSFAKDDAALMAITRGNRSIWWNSDDGSLIKEHFYDGKSQAQLRKATSQMPLAAAVSPDQTMMALLYRGQPIHIWSLENDTLIGLCGRDVGKNAPNISVLTAIFNPNPDLPILAVAYQDGELALYEPWSQKELKSVDGNAYTLAASPDGRTLATGDNRGTVQIWDFETLTLMYRINSGYDEVKSLAFSGDGLRLVDIRDSMTKVWEPSALIRGSSEEDSSVSDAAVLPATTVGINEEIIDITTMTMCPTTNEIFVGKGDGSVAAYDSLSGKQTSTLYSHPNDLFVRAIVCDFEKMIATADAGNRILVWRIQRTLQGAWMAKHKVLDCHLDGLVRQLLFNANGNHLLVSSSVADTIWDLSETDKSPSIFASLPHTGRKQWKWVSDMTQQKGLHLLVNNTLESFDWTRFPNEESVANKLCLPHQNRSLLSDNIEVRNLIIEENGRYLIADYSHVYGDKSVAQLLLWDINSSWNPESNKTTLDHQKSLSEPSFILSSSQMKALLGLAGQKLVFLDRDLWICSIDLGELGADNLDIIRRHFYVPYDFVSSSNGVVGAVNSNGHVAFAKECEIAVVKGGLSWSC